MRTHWWSGFRHGRPALRIGRAHFGILGSPADCSFVHLTWAQLVAAAAAFERAAAPNELLKHTRQKCAMLRSFHEHPDVGIRSRHCGVNS
jgi:hypothetical protein